MNYHITVRELNDSYGLPSDKFIAEACDEQGNTVYVAEAATGGQAYDLCEEGVDAIIAEQEKMANLTHVMYAPVIEAFVESGLTETQAKVATECLVECADTSAPSLLTNKQLLAEYRELPRIINRVAGGHLYKSIPERFKLNKGHESFFGDKLDWLYRRHKDLRFELGRRRRLAPARFKGPYRIDVTGPYIKCLMISAQCCESEWQPNLADLVVSAGRLYEKLGNYKMPDRHVDDIIDADTWLDMVCQFTDLTRAEVIEASRTTYEN